jgi:hypothetical protein
MTAVEVLARCNFLGVRLGAEGEAIVWRADTRPPADLLVAVATHKDTLLALLRGLPPWDQVEAERLLGDLRVEVVRIRGTFATGIPAPLGRLLDDAVVIGERYIRDHELEAARGWDALELLRDLVPHVRDLAARWTPTTSAEQTDALRPR